MESPEGSLELNYNEKDQISELMIDKYHLTYEYNQFGYPIKMILKDKGEMAINYDDNHSIIDIKTELFDQSLDENNLTSYVSESMALLIKRVKEGSIKSYPRWVW